GKSSADVLVDCCELQVIWHQRLDHAPTPRSNHVAAGPRHLCRRKACIWGTRRILFRPGDDDLPRALYFYEISNSRGDGCLVADLGALFSTAHSDSGEAITIGVLGIRRLLCFERVDERLDRAGVSPRRSFPLFAAYWQFARIAAVPAGIELSGFTGDCRPLARTGSPTQSCSRFRPRLSLVLLRERTFLALPEQARAPRLRHCSVVHFLGPVRAVAHALEHLPPASIAGCTPRLAPVTIQTGLTALG